MRIFKNKKHVSKDYYKVPKCGLETGFGNFFSTNKLILDNKRQIEYADAYMVLKKILVEKK